MLTQTLGGGIVVPLLTHTSSTVSRVEPVPFIRTQKLKFLAGVGFYCILHAPEILKIVRLDTKRRKSEYAYAPTNLLEPSRLFF